MDPFKTGSVSPLHDPPESQSPPLSKIQQQYDMTYGAISSGVQLAAYFLLFEKNVLESILLLASISLFYFPILHNDVGI